MTSIKNFKYGPIWPTSFKFQAIFGPGSQREPAIFFVWIYLERLYLAVWGFDVARAYLMLTPRLKIVEGDSNADQDGKRGIFFTCIRTPISYWT